MSKEKRTINASGLSLVERIVALLRVKETTILEMSVFLDVALASVETAVEGWPKTFAVMDGGRVCLVDQIETGEGEMSEAGPDTRTYVMDLQGGGQRRITIPEKWKVTFGPTVPGMKSTGQHFVWAVRIYESKELQRAVFTDVLAIRDMSLKITEKLIKHQSKVVSRDEKGGSANVIVRAEIETWMDPDAPDEEVVPGYDFVGASNDKLLKGEAGDDVDF